MLIKYTGPCLLLLEKNEGGEYAEATLTVLEDCSSAKVRIERLSSQSVFHETFSLDDAILIHSTTVDGDENVNNKETWSFSCSFAAEAIVIVTGSTLKALHGSLAIQQRNPQLTIVPSRFYSDTKHTKKPNVNGYNNVTTLENKNGDNLHIYQIFSRQQHAFDYLDNLLCNCSEARTSHLKVFSFELINSGQRKFLVANYSEFFRRYYSDGNKDIVLSTTPQLPLQKHVYEIIRERHPCRGYFDLEYDKEFNPHTDGNVLTVLWIHLVAWKLSECFHFDEIGKDNFIVLDSSTDKKFSKHVIVILPTTTLTNGSFACDVHDGRKLMGNGNELQNEEIEILFRDNTVVGTMVELILQDITTVFSSGDSSPPPPPYCSLYTYCYLYICLIHALFGMTLITNHI